MPKATIGKRLRELRGAKTQLEVSQSVGVKTNTISMYENGKRTPNDKIKVKLAQYYGVTVESLFFAD